MSFIAELKRRNVVRVAIAYLLAAWVILQVSDVVLPIVDAPDWVGRSILAALGIGFLIVTVLAWIYELTPDGVRREKDIDRSRSITNVTGRKLDFVIIGVLVVAVSMFALDKYVWTKDRYAYDDTQSIAVLPFLNMSSDTEQEYFSDGLTEELLNLLARIPELRVASRTSSFYYKGKDIRMSDLGQDLGVEHVLEGSVRRSGEMVRITAQLVDVPNDAHIWSEVWERTLDDIFAIQDEIAEAVVDALKIRLLGEVPRSRPTSPKAYSLYLEAGEKLQREVPGSHEEAEQLLQLALEIDKGYTPAWLRLADAYSGAASTGNLKRDQLFSLAREVAIEAIRIDPDSREAVEKLSSIGVGVAEESSGDFFSRGIDVLPRVLDGTDAQLILGAEHFDESIAYFESSLQGDSENAAVWYVLGQHYWLARRFDEAAAALLRSIQIDPTREGVHFFLGAALLGAGKYDAALAHMDGESGDGYRLTGRSLVFDAMGYAEQSDAELDRLLERGYRWNYQLAQVFAYRRDTEAAMTWLNRAIAHQNSSIFLLGADPLLDNIRAANGFADAWKAAGLVTP